MLVAQAKRSSELFTGGSIDDGEIDRIERKLSNAMQNIVLVGMPGSGKSTLAALLGRALGRPVCEADEYVRQAAGMSIPEIFERFGEKRFRELETQALRELGKRSGAVISTGGGCVTRRENYAPLHQNGRIIWLRRDTAKLPRDGRPLSQKADLNLLYERRRPLYERFADFTVDNNSAPEDTLMAILEALK